MHRIPERGEDESQRAPDDTRVGRAYHRAPDAYGIARKHDGRAGPDAALPGTPGGAPLMISATVSESNATPATTALAATNAGRSNLANAHKMIISR